MFFESFGAKSCAIDFQTEITECELDISLPIFNFCTTNQ